MGNNELDQKLLRKMFNAIRSAEIKNIKTQKRDDKVMVRLIEKYISDRVKEEMKKLINFQNLLKSTKGITNFISQLIMKKM